MRVGLIGLGVAGQRHAAAFKKIDDVVLAAADPAPAALAAASGLGIRLYPEYTEMVAAESLDAVVVSLPHSMLAEAAIACARQGLHVLVEKPMALTFAPGLGRSRLCSPGSGSPSRRGSWFRFSPSRSHCFRCGSAR